MNEILKCALYRVSQKQMQPINMRKIYNLHKRYGGHLKQTCKKYILFARYQIKFFNSYISFQDMQSFFEFLIPVANHNHINGFH